MNVENIDINSLIGLTKAVVFNLKKTIDNEVTAGDFDDDTKSKIKVMLINQAHDTIYNQVTLILGIHTDSKKEYSDMRESLDARVQGLMHGDSNIDDLIKFIQSLYIDLLTIESDKLHERYSAVMERKTVMIGRQCIGH
jgi:hypothetical protein